MPFWQQPAFCTTIRRSAFSSYTPPIPGALPLAFLFVLIVGLIAGTISGIVGTGSSIMLKPPLRHCERSEAIQAVTAERLWIASLRSQ
jgi:hypothetical protein